MFLLIILLDQVEQSPAGHPPAPGLWNPGAAGAPVRSATAALSAEVPVFAGLRSLALGADEDRLMLVSLLPQPGQEEVERLVQRVQLEMDADEPPMGRLIALPVIAAPLMRRE